MNPIRKLLARLPQFQLPHWASVEDRYMRSRLVAEERASKLARESKDRTMPESLGELTLDHLTNLEPLQWPESMSARKVLENHEQRVKSLEDQQEVFLAHIPNLWKEVHDLKTATPSPATASPTTDSPSAAGPETTLQPTERSWQSAQAIIVDGRVVYISESAEPEDVST